MAETDEGGGRPAPAGGGGGNIFTRKLGPAPVWLWMAALLGALLAWSSYRKNKTAQATPADTTGADTSAQTPPIIIQNYPPATAPGPAGTTATIPGPPAPAIPTGTGGAGSKVTLPGAIPKNFPKLPKPPGRKAAPKPVAYRVKPGDTLDKIAAKYEYSGGGEGLWHFNYGPTSPHSKQAREEIKNRGPNLIYPNETIYIPQ